MGIPREVAHHNAQQNFLFHSDSKAGPGDYNPETSLTSKKAPTHCFKKIAEKFQIAKVKETL